MEQLVILLTMDLTDAAPNGPGWYVSAVSDKQSIIPPVAVSSEAAYEASRALQEALQSTDGELPQIALPQLVESGTRLIRGALESALQRAEREAAKIAGLRKRLSSLPKDKSPTDANV